MTEKSPSSSRRHFLQSTLGSSALLSLGLNVPTFIARSAQATNAGTHHENVLVVVQLSGGNDGLNTIIPFRDEGYHRHRSLLRISANQVLKVDDGIGMHPRMEGFARLLEERQLAIVQGVGYPNPDRSHFRSMDIWHSARPEEDKSSDGWLGRFLDQVPRAAGQDVPALHLGENELPLALTSHERAVPSVQSLDTFRLDSGGGALSLADLQQLARVRRPADAALQFVQRSTLNAFASSQQIKDALSNQRSPVSYPGFGLARKLQSVAQLIDAGLKTRIYYLGLDGFDTHANQMESHANLLAELSGSVAAFIADLKHRGHSDRVLLLTFSEFGRRVHENASHGTDHGAAAPLFLAGSRVKSGLVGKHPSLTELDQEGDLKFHTDFRQVYAAVLDHWLKCSSESVLGQRFTPAAIWDT